MEDKPSTQPVQQELPPGEAEESLDLGWMQGGWVCVEAGGVKVHEAGSMRIVIKGKNLSVAPIAKEYAQKKVGKLARFFNGAQEVLAEVTLRSEKGAQIAEVTLHLGGLILRGEGQKPEMHAAVDEAVSRIERQFQKYRTRIQKRTQQAPSVAEVVSDHAAGSDGPEPEQETDRIVRVKRFPVRPMPVEEAVMQMEMLDHDFFVFANAETGAVNVVYRRRDSGYGLIEPEL